MDNIHATGVPQGDDNFGFIPPDFMYGLNKIENDPFSSKEEMERYFYNLDHEHEDENYNYNY